VIWQNIFLVFIAHGPRIEFDPGAEECSAIVSANKWYHRLLQKRLFGGPLPSKIQ
jgi:hypothetical protein